MKIVSWNVNGIRAVQGKGFAETLARIDADCILLQETKAQEDQVAQALAGIDGYHVHANSAERKGYSGVALLCRQQPLQILRDIGQTDHDSEGRVIAAEYEGFYLVNVYVPNSGDGLSRLDYRQTWDQAFADYLADLQSRKPVIVGATSTSPTKPSTSPGPRPTTTNRPAIPRPRSTASAAFWGAVWLIASAISTPTRWHTVGGVTAPTPAKRTSVGGSTICWPASRCCRA